MADGRRGAALDLFRLAAVMLVRLQKVCTERAEEKRAVPSVGSTWLGPAK